MNTNNNIDYNNVITNGLIIGSTGSLINYIQNKYYDNLLNNNINVYTDSLEKNVEKKKILKKYLPAEYKKFLENKKNTPSDLVQNFRYNIPCNNSSCLSDQSSIINDTSIMNMFNILTAVGSALSIFLVIKEMYKITEKLKEINLSAIENQLSILKEEITEIKIELVSMEEKNIINKNEIVDKLKDNLTEKVTKLNNIISKIISNQDKIHKDYIKISNKIEEVSSTQINSNQKENLESQIKSISDQSFTTSIGKIKTFIGGITGDIKGLASKLGSTKEELGQKVEQSKVLFEKFKDNTKKIEETEVSIKNKLEEIYEKSPIKIAPNIVVEKPIKDNKLIIEFLNDLKYEFEFLRQFYRSTHSGIQKDIRNRIGSLIFSENNKFEYGEVVLFTKKIEEIDRIISVLSSTRFDDKELSLLIKNFTVDQTKERELKNYYTKLRDKIIDQITKQTKNEKIQQLPNIINLIIQTKNNLYEKLDKSKQTGTISLCKNNLKIRQNFFETVNNNLIEDIDLRIPGWLPPKDDSKIADTEPPKPKPNYLEGFRYDLVENLMRARISPENELVIEFLNDLKKEFEFLKKFYSSRHTGLQKYVRNTIGTIGSYIFKKEYSKFEYGEIVLFSKKIEEIDNTINILQNKILDHKNRALLISQFTNNQMKDKDLKKYYTGLRTYIIDSVAIKKSSTDPSEDNEILKIPQILKTMEKEKINLNEKLKKIEQTEDIELCKKNLNIRVEFFKTVNRFLERDINIKVIELSTSKEREERSSNDDTGFIEKLPDLPFAPGMDRGSGSGNISDEDLKQRLEKLKASETYNTQNVKAAAAATGGCYQNFDINTLIYKLDYPF